MTLTFELDTWIWFRSYCRLATHKHIHTADRLHYLDH